MILEHVNSADFRCISTEQFRLPLLGDVLHDSERLSDLDILIKEIGQVGELHAKMLLLVQPLRAVPRLRRLIPTHVIALVNKMNPAVVQHGSDLSGETSNVPVAEDWCRIKILFGLIGWLLFKQILIVLVMSVGVMLLQVVCFNHVVLIFGVLKLGSSAFELVVQLGYFNFQLADFLFVGSLVGIVGCLAASLGSKSLLPLQSCIFFAGAKLHGLDWLVIARHPRSDVVGGFVCRERWVQIFLEDTCPVGQSERDVIKRVVSEVARTSADFMLIRVETLLWKKAEALASLSVRELAKKSNHAWNGLRVLEELNASVTSAGVIQNAVLAVEINMWDSSAIVKIARCKGTCTLLSDVPNGELTLVHLVEASADYDVVTNPLHLLSLRALVACLLPDRAFGSWVEEGHLAALDHCAQNLAVGFPLHGGGEVCEVEGVSCFAFIDIPNFNRVID